MVRKGKKANEPSLDDYWNEGADDAAAAAAAGSAPPAVEEEESVDLSKNKKKKKKNPVGLDDEEEVENRTMDPPGAKKKNAKKNGKVLDAAGSRKDDEETITTASVDDDEETAMELASMMKKKKPKKDKKKGFDDDAGEAPDIEDEEVLDLSAMKKKKPKKKEKKKADADLDDDEVPAAVSTVSPEDEEEMPDFSAMKKKKKNEKKDRKKFLEDEFDEGEVSIPASTASPDEEEEMPDFSTMKKKKKNAKKHVEEDDAEPEVTTSAASATKTEVPDEEEDLLDFSALKKKKPKKKEKKAADAEQNELEVPAADAGVPAAAAAASPDDDDEVLDLTGMKKKPKKKGKKKTVEDDYPEVAAQEWEVPTAESAKPEPAAAPKKDEVPVADSTAIPSSEADPAAPDEEEKLDLPGAKKKKSKKKKPGEKKSEDAAEATAASSASAEVSAASAASAPDTERDKKDETVPAKERETAETTTSSSSKKKKKKASAETQEPKPAKVVEKKVPKHVREMQERLAKMKEEEERRKREEEEKLRKEEEERLRLEEEERLREEAKQRRKQREKEKIKDKKAKGLYLTGKQKMEARRLAIIKEQILASNPNLAAGEEPSPTPRKPKYETKKKKDANAKEEESEKLAEDAEGGAEAAAAEEAEHEGSGEHEGNGEVDTAEAAAAEAAAAEAAAVETEAAAEEEEEEEDDDDWEAKSWDDESKLPTVKDAFADEDEEEEEQPVVVPEKPVKAAPKVAEQAPAAAPAHAPAPVSREARMAEALSKRSASDLRSPICCILGHVDTGKTKLLDCIRRTNVQEGEAGGITQQIGATYFPMENIRERTKELPEAANMRVPGLLVIDTPGHESFTNLRSRGSGLCDIAILVIDIMHGLEPQTIESINLLKMRKTPFIVALNKVDRLYQWKSRYNAPIRTALQEQEKDTRSEFETRAKQIIMELQVQSLNSEIYWKNKDKRKTVSIVPTSAISGEGIPDLLYLLILLTQEMMEKKLMYVSEVQCTVLEVKVVEGLGTTIDVVLVNGVLHEGDQIVVCGMQGPIVTTIRALLTPHPMKELRVKGSYQHHKELKAAQGIKITAQGLEHAIAGTQLYIVGPDDDVDAIKEEAMKDVNSVMSRIDKSGEGVCVQASTLGSLEALLEFLKSPDVNIPVSGISIGPVHKKDIMRAGVMLERKKEYATILAFDVKVTSEARELAEETGVKIFTADIIYHLFDQFTAYLKNTREEKRRDTADEAIFPCILQILPNCVFNKKDPIIVGVTVLEGIAKVGTPICVHGKDGEFIDLGRIASLEINHKVVDVAKKGDEVAMKILGDENQKMFGRHFDYEDMLVSHITRRSIDILKENYRNELSPEEWKLIVKLKGIFKIM